MKKFLIILICCLFVQMSYAQFNYRYKAIPINVGLAQQNLYNTFNSPIRYSGAGFSATVGYLETDYNKMYQEVRLAFSSSNLKPKYIKPNDFNPKDIFVSSINVEAKYRYALRVNKESSKVKLLVGGCAMIDFGIRSNSAMGNGSTDINLTLLSLGASGGIIYNLSNKMNLVWFIDVPFVSFIYYTPYLGGIMIEDKFDFKVASFGSYQKIASDLSLELFMKNGNGFRATYAFGVMNNSNNQKITIGSHSFYLGFLFNLSKPRK